MASCSTFLERSHAVWWHWRHVAARELTAMGHEVRLIPPAYVKPYVKRHKNDAVDAEAICEAGQRPSMRFVAVKTEVQQAAAMVFRTRDLAVKQHTQLGTRFADIWLNMAGSLRRAPPTSRCWRICSMTARSGKRCPRRRDRCSQ